MATYDNILQTIGKTPLVKLNSIPENLQSTIYAKVEYLNPGGSNKDRIALTMIEAAEKLLPQTRRNHHRSHRR